MDPTGGGAVKGAGTSSGGAGGAANDDTSSTTDASSSTSTTGEPACTATGMPMLVSEINPYALELQVHNGSVYFLDNAPGERLMDRIRRISLDLSEDEIVHVIELGLFDMLDFSFTLDESFVYFSHDYSAWRVPLEGGTEELVTLPEREVDLSYDFVEKEPTAIGAPPLLPRHPTRSPCARRRSPRTGSRRARC